MPLENSFQTGASFSIHDLYSAMVARYLEWCDTQPLVTTSGEQTYIRQTDLDARNKAWNGYVNRRTTYEDALISSDRLS